MVQTKTKIHTRNSGYRNKPYGQLYNCWNIEDRCVWWPFLVETCRCKNYQKWSCVNGFDLLNDDVKIKWNVWTGEFIFNCWASGSVDQKVCVACNIQKMCVARNIPKCVRVTQYTKRCAWHAIYQKMCVARNLPKGVRGTEYAKRCAWHAIYKKVCVVSDI